MVTTSLATHYSIDGDGDGLLSRSRSTGSRGGLHPLRPRHPLQSPPHPQRSEMAGMEGFEFFEIVIEKSCSRQRLPHKFVKMLAGREPHKVKLREAGSRRRRLWDVVVVFDGEGHMYLGIGWEHFAHAHELHLGHFLVFRYDGDTMFTVKMFDNTMCCMYYQHDDDASNGSSSGDDEEQSGKEEEQSGDDEEQSGDDEEQSRKVQPILADDDLAMVVADDDPAMVVADDELAIVVPDGDFAMVVPNDDLAMVVAQAIPQLGDRTMPIVVEEYIRVGIRHSERIRRMKENKEKNE
ncbi:B3 domain-containing protein At3g18960-like isoform X2 [Triticum dicoccoides]|uniref:B3 domain-containing protein At3g18960-like isoform X2 n=1 Tax=Triticum dicoccoides TaxID=85692 RepID=UPI0018902758|nr:B3 domain-containing protein At3g18960-like isoform X2 [Triticum dicoccoides]